VFCDFLHHLSERGNFYVRVYHLQFFHSFGWNMRKIFVLAKQGNIGISAATWNGRFDAIQDVNSEARCLLHRQRVVPETTC
jgi:hypothetical protein